MPHSDPRWIVSYRQAADPKIQTTIIEGGTLVAAYKAAIAKLWARGAAVRIIGVTEDQSILRLDPTPLVDTAPSEKEPA